MRMTGIYAVQRYRESHYSNLDNAYRSCFLSFRATIIHAAKDYSYFSFLGKGSTLAHYSLHICTQKKLWDYDSYLKHGGFLRGMMEACIS
jgi:hypothetical protein